MAGTDAVLVDGDRVKVSAPRYDLEGFDIQYSTIIVRPSGKKFVKLDDSDKRHPVLNDTLAQIYYANYVVTKI